MRVTIASRRSELARIQASQVGNALQSAYPQIEINYSFHESLGDKNQNDPLWQMPEKGVFTQDFREGLLRGEFDLVVHSWKDLAIEEDPETEIAATLPRADARDLLLVRKDRWPEVEANGVMSILTSSPRRGYNLDSFLRDALPARLNELNFVNVRGNVPTRVRKLFELDVDGLIVAKAALDRLLEARGSSPTNRGPHAGIPRGVIDREGSIENEFAATQKNLREALSQCRFVVLPLRANPSAPAQGALAIEISRRRDDLRERLVSLNCAETYAVVAREREILASYGGGCHQKIGASVLRRPFGEITFLRGVTDDGQILDSCSLNPSTPRPRKIAKEGLWPLRSSDADWFSREVLRSSAPDESAALWVAKADAFPDHWQVSSAQIVWTSGLKTWKRLAARGIWVNGSAESLGEQEPPNIGTLVGAKLHWLKLTHESGYDGGVMPSVATYRLVSKNGNLNVEGKKYFFWGSGSSFEHALSLHPWLKDMTHFCGPGNTQRILERHGIRPHIFLDHAQWLQEMCQNQER